MTNELPTKEQYLEFARAAAAQLDQLPEWKEAWPDARRAKIIEIATGGQGTKLEDVVHLDEALDKVRDWVAAQQPAPVQTTAATDWLVSVTPNRNGDYETAGGARFNITLHNGATAEAALALVLEMDRAHALLAQHGIHFYDPPAAVPVADKPAQPRGNAPAQRPATLPAKATGGTQEGDGQGYDVFGVGKCYAGKVYEVAIARVKPGATLNNAPTLDLYRAGDKFRFLTIFERQFAEFTDATGTDPVTLDPRQEMAVNLKVFFRLATNADGSVKTTDKGNPRIDFAGIA